MKECLNTGRRLHAWRARLVVIQTKHLSGTTNTLKSTIKLRFFPVWYHKRIYKIKDLIGDNGKFLPFDVSCCIFYVKACFTTYYGLHNSIRQNWNAISKESHGVLELISNWRTHKIIILVIEKKIYALQQFKQNLTNAYKRELPTLTVDSTEHPVLAGCSADIDL